MREDGKKGRRIKDMVAVEVCNFYEEHESPCEALLRAILHRSILDLTLPEKEHRRSAKGFFLRYQHPPYEPFSFLWIAEVLGFNAGDMLKRLESLGILAETKEAPKGKRTKGKRRQWE